MLQIAVKQLNNEVLTLKFRVYISKHNIMTIMINESIKPRDKTSKKWLLQLIMLKSGQEMKRFA